jgi:sugar phosphate isomerase/epimerase
MMPGDWRRVDAGVAARIRAAGFTGVSCVFSDPFDADDRSVDRLKEFLDDAGLRAAQTNALYESLVNPDEALRRRGVAGVQRMCHVARRLDACFLYVRPGSLNPNGHWWPHPDNHKPETIDRLAQSLKDIVPVAESEGVRLGIEGHVVSPLDTPERVREVIERVGSPALRFNVDPVNFVGTLRDVYDSTPLLNRLFDCLGPYTISAHAKDVDVEDRHVLHIREVVIGEGRLDQETFLRRFEAACPDGFVLIEHLPDDLVPKAKAALDAAARRAGLRWKE